MQLVNKYWRGICNSTDLWRLLDATLDFSWRIAKTHCIVERRSKGRLFKGYQRSTLTPVIVRKVHLDIANAGKDDGLPTSVLREISYLSELDSPHVVKILGANVLDDVVHICTEYVDYNLKDYMRFQGKINSDTVASIVK